MKLKFGDKVCRIDRDEPSMIGMVERVSDNYVATIRWSDGTRSEHVANDLQVLI